MPDPRWMSVVIYQRQQSGGMGDSDRPPYADVDAEPLPPAPERDATRVASWLGARLRAVIRTSRSSEGALP